MMRFCCDYKKEACGVCPCHYWCSARTRKRNPDLVYSACRFANRLHDCYSKINALPVGEHENWWREYANFPTLAEDLSLHGLRRILEQENSKEAKNFRQVLFCANDLLRDALLLPIRRGFVIEQETARNKKENQ